MACAQEFPILITHFPCMQSSASSRVRTCTWQARAFSSGRGRSCVTVSCKTRCASQYGRQALVDGAAPRTKKEAHRKRENNTCCAMKVMVAAVAHRLYVSFSAAMSSSSSVADAAPRRPCHTHTYAIVHHKAHLRESACCVELQNRHARYVDGCRSRTGDVEAHTESNSVVVTP